MIKYLILALVLTGCTTVVPVTVKFPEVPGVLMEPCSTLASVTTPELSELTKTVVQNYAEYHNCSNKTQAWQVWYTQQKALYKELYK